MTATRPHRTPARRGHDVPAHLRAGLPAEGPGFAGTAAPRVQWRVLGGMYSAAGAVGLLMLALGVDTAFDARMLTLLAVFAIAFGGSVIAMARRLPGAWIVAGLILGVFLISLAVFASGEADTPFALLYIWVAVKGWYFLRPRVAGALTAVTVMGSAATMAAVATPYDHAASWWLMIVATVLAVSVLAAVLRLRADRLVAALSDAAARDPLTGLLNRAGFEQRSAAELARASRHDTPFAVVLGDLDRFKALNDTFGHRGGDDALREFSALCRAHSRFEDVIARVGGEEFALIMPDTDEAGGVLAAERLRLAAASGLAGPDGSPVTASFGVAAYPAHGSDVRTLLDRADRAMYAAKSLGRDRTVAFSAIEAADE